MATLQTEEELRQRLKELEEKAAKHKKAALDGDETLSSDGHSHGELAVFYSGQVKMITNEIEALQRTKPKGGDWVILPNGKRKRIDSIEQGIAFWGHGNNEHAPLVNLVPALTGEQNCWQIDPTR